VEAERWQKVEQIYNEALACEVAQRAAVLDRSCGQDASLRNEVESLLKYSQHTEPALEKPALEILAEELANDLNRQPAAFEKMIGRRIGQYKIIGKLGAGGMGDVYRAVRADEAYQQHVALKLLRDSLQDRDAAFFLAQFRNERQILANLQHPNIARLFDGGATEDGIPYFVMELVEGQPIHEYCDQHRLSITKRLDLFLQIASAVQYAHQRLIVHRDIKPANILVKADGVPVLLDFGIAKIIDPATQAIGTPATLTGMRIMTPEYACPEQIRGEAVTTATDVYSLGVVLYELLSGHRPYRITTNNPLEIARVICEEEPKKPSTAVTNPAPGAQSGVPEQIAAARGSEPPRLARQLRGDLDAVLLKALRKEPEQRYATAGELADDIRRYLEGRPVMARRGTRTYHARKFVMRHRVAVAATAFCCVLAVAGVISILRAEHTARVEQARAEQRFNDVRALATSLLFEIHDAIRDLPGSTAARKLIVDRALKYLDSLARESSGDIGLQRELAAAYERVGDVQGQALQANLGDKTGAMASYKKALNIREAVAAANLKDLEIRRALVPNYGKLSDLSWNLGDSAAAIQFSQQTMAISQGLYDADSKNGIYRRLLASALLDYGLKQAMIEGNIDAGLQNLEKGMALLEQMVAENPKDMRLRRNLGLSYSRAAEITARDPHKSEQALTYLRKALEMQTANSEADPTNAELRRLAAYDRYSLGEQLRKMERYSESLEDERAALEVFRDLSQKDPANKELREDIGYVEGDIGKALVSMSRTQTAVQQLQSALSTLTAIPEARQPKSRVSWIILRDQYWLGKAYTAAAFAGGHSRPDASACQQARIWFSKSLAGLKTNGAGTTNPATSAGETSGLSPADIQSDMARCGSTQNAFPLSPQ
jgi:eukaryotic-like serine/threonine-protein kinase